MNGVGGRLWTVLALTYAALGLFSLLVYDDLAISAVGVLGAIAMLGLTFGVAWASGELAARRGGHRR